MPRTTARTRTTAPSKPAPAATPADAPPASTPITLDQLSDEDRERLRIEAANEAKIAAQPTPPAPETVVLTDEQKRQIHAEVEREKAEAARTTGDAFADARIRGIAALMEERDHARSCPMEPTRIECYAARRPADRENAIPAQDLTVIRCQECGESVVSEQSYTETIAGVEAALVPTPA